MFLGTSPLTTIVADYSGRLDGRARWQHVAEPAQGRPGEVFISAIKAP
ncbi:hypothetical protein [Microbacterium sp. 10M-3C3]|jgi:hypothetical protein|nr:hypothetical protein [Microbacterium sp. 10M-3C3]